MGCAVFSVDSRFFIRKNDTVEVTGSIHRLQFYLYSSLYIIELISRWKNFLSALKIIFEICYCANFAYIFLFEF